MRDDIGRTGQRSGPSSGCGKDASRASRKGREQGVDQQRALLCRMAAARFGADTAARLTDVLAPITDRIGWPRSATGWCDATSAPSSSPASIAPHPPDARRLTRTPACPCRPTAPTRWRADSRAPRSGRGRSPAAAPDAEPTSHGRRGCAARRISVSRNRLMPNRRGGGCAAVGGRHRGGSRHRAAMPRAGRPHDGATDTDGPGP